MGHVAPLDLEGIDAPEGPGGRKLSSYGTRNALHAIPALGFVLKHNMDVRPRPERASGVLSGQIKGSAASSTRCAGPSNPLLTPLSVCLPLHSSTRHGQGETCPAIALFRQDGPKGIGQLICTRPNPVIRNDHSSFDRLQVIQSESNREHEPILHYVFRP